MGLLSRLSRPFAFYAGTKHFKLFKAPRAKRYIVEPSKMDPSIEHLKGIEHRVFRLEDEWLQHSKVRGMHLIEMKLITNKVYNRIYRVRARESNRVESNLS
jgi:hypothetical protein